MKSSPTTRDCGAVRRSGRVWLHSGLVLLAIGLGCGKAANVPDNNAPVPVANNVPDERAVSQAVIATEANGTASRSPAEPPSDAAPVVLFDSYHAHNFLHLGLRPGEYSYHVYSGLRRAAQLLEQRGCVVEEWLIGPLSREKLEGVALLVLNLPSMDRPPMLVEEVLALEEFVRNGGGLLIITDHSNCYYHQYQLLPLLDRLGITPTFETVCEREPSHLLTPTGNAWIAIRQFSPHPVTEGLSMLGLQTAGRVVGVDGVAHTTAAAWADAGAVPLFGEGNVGLIGDLQYSDAEDAGVQDVVLAREVDRGRIVVIADQNCVGDAAIAYADHQRLWLNAAGWCGRLSYQEQGVSHEQEWDVLCWEPLSRSAEAGPGMRAFDWGGESPEQLHYFWVWLNRSRWARCHESFPQVDDLQAEDLQNNELRRSRPLLLGCLERASERRLQAAIEECLERDGRVVLLAQPPAPSVSETVQPDSEATQPVEGLGKAETLRPEETALARRLRQLGIGAEWMELVLSCNSLRERAEMEWEEFEPASPNPLPGVAVRLRPSDAATRSGELWLVTDRTLLGNATFPPPNVPPGSAQATFERRLAEWLFGR